MIDKPPYDPEREAESLAAKVAYLMCEDPVQQLVRIAFEVCDNNMTAASKVLRKVVVNGYLPPHIARQPNIEAAFKRAIKQQASENPSRAFAK